MKFVKSIFEKTIHSILRHQGTKVIDVRKKKLIKLCRQDDVLNRFDREHFKNYYTFLLFTLLFRTSLEKDPDLKKSTLDRDQGIDEPFVVFSGTMVFSWYSFGISIFQYFHYEKKNDSVLFWNLKIETETTSSSLNMKYIVIWHTNIGKYHC